MTPATPCGACGGELEPTAALRAPDRNDAIPGTWSIHTCRRCGSGTTLPPATDEDLPGFYVEDYAPFRSSRGTVARARAWVQATGDRRFPLSALAQSAPAQGVSAGGARPGTLLDVGCGRGELSGSWRERGWRTLGIEPSPQAAAAARERGVEIVGPRVADADCPPEAVDAAVFSHSLEHVVDPQADLAHVFALLRPGGRVAILAPNWGSWQRRTFGEHWFPLELPRHRTHFTAEGLRAALAGAGFTAVEVRTATPFITTTWSLQIRAFGRLLSRDGFALFAGYALCALIAPPTAIIDRLRGGGDFLHAVAVKPAGLPAA